MRHYAVVWLGGGLFLFINLQISSNFVARARSKNYKQVVAGTKNLGVLGGQFHIGKVNKLDPALRGGYLNNVVVSCMQNNTMAAISGEEWGFVGAFTVYLSNSASGDWQDSQILTAKSTAAGGGTVSLSAKRFIKDDANADDSSISPVHIWLEMTDVTAGATDMTARVVIESWGRMVLLTGDF